MGALHQGHASLLSQCREECAVSVLSIFVNPLQFGPTEDLTKYPRTLDSDLALAEREGVDVVYVPLAAHLTERQTTTVHVTGVSELFEGERRPGHFEGVATIVCKLMNIVVPDMAYFGLKDLQQCAVIRRMVEDLDMTVKLRFCETVREESGLALSSRNAYLSPDERQRASKLYETLVWCVNRIASGSHVGSVLVAGGNTLREAGFETEYLNLVDPSTMTPLDQYQTGGRLTVAARYCGVRLIDNVELPAR